MNDVLSVRTATAADAESIAALTEALGYPANADKMRKRLSRLMARTDSLVLAAQTNDGQVCGWLQAEKSEVLESGTRVEIVGLIVANKARRQGVGKMLVQAAEAWARRVGVEAVVVRSNVQREESHAFYGALGYVRMKTQHVYRKPIT